MAIKKTNGRKETKKTIQPLRVKKSEADKVKGGLMMGPEELP